MRTLSSLLASSLLLACGAVNPSQDAANLADAPGSLGAEAALPDVPETDASALPEASADAGDAGEAGASDAGVTVLRVHYPRGARSITVRGGAGGLDWMRGAATTVEDADTVRYTLTGLTQRLEWKPLLGDTTWARGPNYHADPGATVDVYPHFEAQRGMVVTLFASFTSTRVGPRAVYAYLPPSYLENTAARFPVVYMHDGQNLWESMPALAFGATWDVDTAFDRAAERGACSTRTQRGWAAQTPGATPTLCNGDGDCPSGECVTFPEALVVGVANTSARVNEYTPTTDPGRPGGGGADAYLAMLTLELKPRVDAMLRTRPEVRSTVLAGSSLGGLVTAYAGLRNPEVWGALGEFSPSTWWNNTVIVTDVLGTRPAPARPSLVYVDSGGSADGQADTDMLAAAYEAVGYTEGRDLRHVVQPSAVHEEVYWAQRFPGAMQFLLGER